MMKFDQELKRARITVYMLMGKFLTYSFYSLEGPFFIIGTGRCGTSLLTKILNSHKRVVGFPSEANDLWHPNSYPFSDRSIVTPTIIENPKRFTELSTLSWPHKHEQRIRDVFAGYHFISGNSRILFVKSAMISFMVPKILKIFPQAQFIHIYRNGPSVVESLVKKNWSKNAHRYSGESEYRLRCARYWNDCIMELEHQKTSLSLDERGAWLEFSYERLCDSPAAILRDIAGFLGVDFSGFSYEVSQIVSRNYKVGDYADDNRWTELLDVMSEGMDLKGYPTR